MARRQGVYWILTIPEEDWEPNLPEGIRYVKGQLEEGEGGFRHYQVLAVLSKKASAVRVRELFGGRAHCELSRSRAANDYVWKEDTRVGEPFEYGELPFKRNDPKDWDRIWDMAREGRILDIPADVRIQHYRTLRTITADFAKPIGMERSCYVFCGKTGTGKSRRAWLEAGVDAYPKDPRTKFWDGYRDQKHVVIDEFRGAIDISHILRWLDRYPVLVEIKGSATSLVAEKIWITSNLHPRDWFKDLDSETQDALLRRLQITIFDGF